mmetsp:Transcript_52843/g.72389  ORF Transcript_52843/g.72389 Transcript_52843/m.72389 type:complete len:321 (-) Transcript_52843:5-967(-)
MAAAVDLDQARARGSHHHLRVCGTVGDSQRVEAAARVRDELLRHLGVSEHALLPEADEVAAVGRPTVVHPDQGALVHAVAGHVVNDVFRAPKELLQEHRSALSAALALRAHQQLEVGAGLLHSVAELDAIGARGLDGLDDDGELLGLGERDNIVPDSAAGRAHRPQPRRLDRILLHALVAAIFHAISCAIPAQAQVLRERVANLDACLAAADHRCQLSTARGLAEDVSCPLERMLLLHLRQEVLREAHCRLGEVPAVLAALLRPEGYHREAALGQLRGEHGARGVRVDQGNARLGDLRDLGLAHDAEGGQVCETERETAL